MSELTPQLKAALEEKLRAIHNRFHGRYETHAKVAKHSPWTNQELENVQLEDEWLMYQEIFDLFQPEIERLVVEAERKVLMSTLSPMKNKILGLTMVLVPIILFVALLVLGLFYEETRLKVISMLIVGTMFMMVLYGLFLLGKEMK